MYLGVGNSCLEILGLSCSLSHYCILQVSLLGENWASIILFMLIQFTNFVWKGLFSFIRKTWYSRTSLMQIPHITINLAILEAVVRISKCLDDYWQTGML
jgi:hypothetical protein